MEPTDSRRALAEWAKASDMDPAELAAMQACLGVAGGSEVACELAWAPVAAWGSRASSSGLRKLARIALGRQIMRDWISELSWEDDPAQKENLRAACQELSLLCAQSREALAWGEALESLGRGVGKIESILRRGPGDRAARSALMGALGSWVDEETQALAASRALALIQAHEIQAGIPESGQGDALDSQGRGRL